MRRNALATGTADRWRVLVLNRGGMTVQLRTEAEPAERRLRGESLRTLLALYYIVAGGFGPKATLTFAPKFIETVPTELRLKMALGFGRNASIFLVIVVVGALLQRGWRFAGIAGSQYKFPRYRSGRLVGACTSS